MWTVWLILATAPGAFCSHARSWEGARRAKETPQQTPALPVHSRCAPTDSIDQSKGVCALQSSPTGPGPVAPAVIQAGGVQTQQHVGDLKSSSQHPPHADEHIDPNVYWWLFTHIFAFCLGWWLAWQQKSTPASVTACQATAADAVNKDTTAANCTDSSAVKAGAESGCCAQTSGTNEKPNEEHVSQTEMSITQSPTSDHCLSDTAASALSGEAVHSMQHSVQHDDKTVSHAGQGIAPITTAKEQPGSGPAVTSLHAGVFGSSHVIHKFEATASSLTPTQPAAVSGAVKQQVLQDDAGSILNTLLAEVIAPAQAPSGPEMSPAAAAAAVSAPGADACAVLSAGQTMHTAESATPPAMASQQLPEHSSSPCSQAATHIGGVDYACTPTAGSASLPETQPTSSSCSTPQPVSQIQQATSNMPHYESNLQYSVTTMPHPSSEVAGTSGAGVLQPSAVSQPLQFHFSAHVVADPESLKLWLQPVTR